MSLSWPSAIFFVAAVGCASLMPSVVFAQDHPVSLTATEAATASGIPVGGTMADVNSNAIANTLSTTGPLFFGLNGDGASGSVAAQSGFRAIDVVADRSIEDGFAITIDASAASLLLTQVQSPGSRAGDSLTLISDVSSGSFEPQARELEKNGLGADSLSNLNRIAMLGRNATMDAAVVPDVVIDNQEDTSGKFGRARSVAARFQPTASTTAVANAKTVSGAKAQGKRGPSVARALSGSRVYR